MAKDKPVAGKKSGAKADMISTGKRKAQAASSKTYEPPVKGSGKPKYQNVTKENRLNTKERQVNITKHVKEKIAGKKVTQQEKRALGNKAENVAKQIDREYKVQKGVRTEKPSTPRVPVKGGRGGAGIMGAFGIKNK